MDPTDTPLPAALELPPLEAPIAHELPVADAAGSPEDKPKRTPRALHRNTSPFRALIVVMTGFVGLFLVMRTIAVEPFGVPTGSMAPALSGHHRDGFCPRCGYVVRVGRPTTGSVTEHFKKVTCPNCDNGLSLVEANDLGGDRLLVDKNIYDLRTPRRWEMVVFRCPNTNEEFGKPYVKRLVGLPGETITIVDGDVYVNGEIARKGIAEVRETVMPIFDMNFTPHSSGWNPRWLVEVGGDPRLPVGAGPTSAGSPAIESNSLVLDASDTPQSTTAVRYRNWHLDDRKEYPVRVWNSYDGTSRRNDMPAAHDFYLTCEVEVTAAVGAVGEACFDCRLSDGADTVTAEITVGLRKTGRAQLIRENHGGLGSANGVALEPGRRYKLEFAFVDRRAIISIDGRVVLPPADLEPATRREPVSRPLRLGSRGCRVVVRDLKLFRDIHYTAEANDYHATRHPAVLGARQYFVLGDNSGNSEDSRKWPNPAVPESSFIGKPFLIHQPLRLGRVSVGGRERVFQSLDWSRLRWLH